MIKTFSIFYYGHNITAQNYNLPFKEGVPELNAQLTIGTNTLSEFVVNLQTALNAAADTRIFTVSVNRTTRKITISADGNFSLLVNTGLTIGSGVFELAGFTGADRTGASSYTGNLPSGFAYEPQFMLQSYVDKEAYQESAEASVNESASGNIEVVRFGINKYYEFDIKFITNIAMDGKVIKNNPNGLADAISFLKDITKRNKFEFMPDIDNRSVFDKVILDQINGSSTATGYKLRELYTQNLPDIYETGVLRVRVIGII